MDDRELRTALQRIEGMCQATMILAARASGMTLEEAAKAVDELCEISRQSATRFAAAMEKATKDRIEETLTSAS